MAGTNARKTSFSNVQVTKQNIRKEHVLIIHGESIYCLVLEWNSYGKIVG